MIFISKQGHLQVYMELSKWQGQKPDRPHNCKWEMEKVSDVGVKRGADCGSDHHLLL